MKGDRPVPGVHCPHCRGQVVYNGNYFCEHLGNGCGWALSHNDQDGGPIGATDKRLWAEIRRALNLGQPD